MLEKLGRRWKPTFAWEDYAPLCDRLTEMRAQLRQAHGVKNPRMFCRHCDGVHEMVPAPVTIRSVLFALNKKGLLTKTQLDKMDIEWRRYRAKHRLDGRGVKRAAACAEPGDGARFHFDLPRSQVGEAEGSVSVGQSSRARRM